MEINIFCNEANAKVQVTGTLTSGMAGIQLHAYFGGSVWDGLAKVAHARCWNEHREIALDSHGNGMIPWEVMLGGQMLEIGVDGLSPDGSIRIPTVWAKAGVVRRSAAGDYRLEPSPDMMHQILGIANDAQTVAQNALAEAAAARDAAETYQDSAQAAALAALKSKDAAESAQAAAEAAQAEAEAAQAKAEAAQAAAEAAQAEAETAQAGAEAAQAAAEAAQGNADDAKRLAEAARDTAESYAAEAANAAGNAAASATGAANSAQTARAAAEEAKAEAIRMQERAETAMANAEAAKAAAEAASREAAAAKNKAETAQAKAEAAQAAAEQARTETQAARDAAQTAANTAEGKLAELLDATYSKSQIDDKIAQATPQDYDAVKRDLAEQSAVNRRQNTAIQSLMAAAEGPLYYAHTDDAEAYTKAVPADVLPMALLDGWGGRTVARNQLCNAEAASGVQGRVSAAGDALTYTIVNPNGAARVEFPVRLFDGHRYLQRRTILSPHQTATNTASLTSLSGVQTVPANQAEALQNIIAADAAMSAAGVYRIYISTNGTDDPFSVGDTITLTNVALVDLTQWFGAEIADTITTPEQAYALGVPSEPMAYDPGTAVHADVESIDITGRNLLYLTRKGEYEIYGLRLNVSPDGSSFTAVGTPTATVRLPFFGDESYSLSEFPYDSGSYIVSRDVEQVGDATAVPQIYIGSAIVQPGTAMEFTRGALNHRLQFSSSAAYNCKVKIAMTRGSAPVPYTPYHPPISKAVPADVHDLPGYGWSVGDICNEVDIANKRYIQRVGKIDPSAFAWSRWQDEENAIFYCNSITSPMCTGRYPYIDITSVTSNGPAAERMVDMSICIRHGAMDRIYLKDTSCETPAELREKLGNEAYVVLDAPITTDITELLPPDSDTLDVAEGDSITFTQASGLVTPIPNSITYCIKAGGGNYE